SFAAKLIFQPPDCLSGSSLLILAAQNKLVDVQPPITFASELLDWTHQRIFDHLLRFARLIDHVFKARRLTLFEVRRDTIQFACCLRGLVDQARLRVEALVDPGNSLAGALTPLGKPLRLPRGAL